MKEHSLLAVKFGDLFTFSADSLTAEIMPKNLNQRRGSELILREALRRESSRDSISGSRPLQPQRTANQHPAVASRSLSLQAAPSPGAMEKTGPFAKRSRSTKKREGKTQSLICFNNPEGKYLKDLMWDRPVLESFMDTSVSTTPKKNLCTLLFSACEEIFYQVLFLSL